MKTIKGPAIFLAQFAGSEAPFNSLPAIADWAAGLGYKGLQIPTWEKNLFDLDLAASSQTYCDELKGMLADKGLEVTELSTHLQGQLVAVHPAFDAQFDGFAPAEVHGNPAARQAWAVDHSAQLTLLWFAGFTDPYLMLLNFLSESFNPIVGAEGGGIDPLLHQLSVASAPDDRKMILQSIEEQISTEAHLQFIASRNNFVAWRNDLLDGVVLQDADGYGLPYWHGVQEWSPES